MNVALVYDAPVIIKKCLQGHIVLFVVYNFAPQRSSFENWGSRGSAGEQQRIYDWSPKAKVIGLQFSQVKIAQQ